MIKNYSDPCFVNNGGCDKNAFCEDENEDEVSECKCKPGYSGNGKNCINNCQDEHTNCPFWATHGECSNSPTYMHAYCKKSCGLLCKNICEDEHTTCPFWATQGDVVIVLPICMHIVKNPVKSVVKQLATM